MISGATKCPSFVLSIWEKGSKVVEELDQRFSEKVHLLLSPSLAYLAIKVTHATPWAVIFLFGGIYVRLPLLAGVLLIRWAKPSLLPTLFPPTRRINLLRGNAICLAITTAKTVILFSQTAALPLLFLIALKVGFCAFSIIRAQSIEKALVLSSIP
jgi:hypothetical protein